MPRPGEFVKQKGRMGYFDIQICVYEYVYVYIYIYIYTYILEGLLGFLDFLCCCWCKHLEKKMGRALKAVVPPAVFESSTTCHDLILVRLTLGHLPHEFH